MYRITAKCSLLLITALVAASACAQKSSSRSEPTEIVWTWSKRCSGDHKLGVTVRLDSRVLYRGVLPICRGSRDAQGGRVEFHFAGGHNFQGEYPTRSTNRIEGDIWQAEGDPDDSILGISFATAKQILLNTLHVARPDKQASSELDQGVFIATEPAPVQ
jgi:hypothetical protein